MLEQLGPRQQGGTAILQPLLPQADDGRSPARRCVAGHSCPVRVHADRLPGADFQNTDFYPKGTRAIQLYDSSVDSQFLQSFNACRIVCECERSDEPSLVQALHISNGETVNKKLKDPAGPAAQLVELRKQGMADSAIIDEVYLAGLSRYPTADERAGLLKILSETPPDQIRETIGDLFWAVFSSREVPVPSPIRRP